VDFCTISKAKIPIIRRAFGVCRVKNRLIGDFLEWLRGKRNKFLEAGKGNASQSGYK
jgi:hypothetical protein